MCLIAFAVGQNPHFPLVVAANRDEFFRRPTAAMDWWTTESGTRVLAGRDLRGQRRDQRPGRGTGNRPYQSW